MKEMMEKYTVRFIAKFVKQFINETVTSTSDITVHEFVNSQIELFAIWFFEKLQFGKYIKFNSMGITPDAVKDIAIWTIITKLQLVGKIAGLYTNGSKTITINELLDDDTILEFIKYCKNVKNLTDDIFNAMLGNPEMVLDTVKDLAKTVFDEARDEINASDCSRLETTAT